MVCGQVSDTAEAIVGAGSACIVGATRCSVWLSVRHARLTCRWEEVEDLE